MIGVVCSWCGNELLPDSNGHPGCHRTEQVFIDVRNRLNAADEKIRQLHVSDIIVEGLKQRIVHLEGVLRRAGMLP